jgi:integrase
LALFAVAIDTMLPGPQLLDLTVKDVQRSDGTIRSVIQVARPKGRPPVRCALSKATATALGKWIAVSGKRRPDHIFSSRKAGPHHAMTVRQLSRLLKLWFVEAGLDPKKYGKESLRRTRATHILDSTGDIETVRALLGHTQVETTARFLRITRKSDPIAIAQAFEI